MVISILTLGVEVDPAVISEMLQSSPPWCVHIERAVAIEEFAK